MSNKNEEPKYNHEEILKGLTTDDILKEWDYEGTNLLETRIQEFKDHNPSDTKEIKDIINQIVLWKVQRQVFFKDESLLDDIMKLGKEKGLTRKSILKKHKEKVTNIIIRMLKCQGIRLPMASTILHFFYPNVFLIIDQRAYRVVKAYRAVKEGELNKAIQYTKKLQSCSKEDACADVYLDYMDACNKYYENHNFGFKFSELDRFTYQLDIKAGNKVNY